MADVKENKKGYYSNCRVMGRRLQFNLNIKINQKETTLELNKDILR